MKDYFGSLFFVLDIKVCASIKRNSPDVLGIRSGTIALLRLKQFHL